MNAGAFRLRGSAVADHREMAVKAAGALTAVGAVRDTTFDSNLSVAFRFEVDGARLAELRERLVATGVKLDASSEALLRNGRTGPSPTDARTSVEGTLEIHFARATTPHEVAAQG